MMQVQQYSIKRIYKEVMNDSCEEGSNVFVQKRALTKRQIKLKKIVQKTFPYQRSFFTINCAALVDISKELMMS